MHQGPSKRNWFTSWEFRIWYLGMLACPVSAKSNSWCTNDREYGGHPGNAYDYSYKTEGVGDCTLMACLYDLRITHIRLNPQCQAWIFLAGSSAGLFTSVSFIYVLIRFPIFIRHVKTEGAEPDVVVRLSTFYHLNVSLLFPFQPSKINLAHYRSFARCSVSVSLSPCWSLAWTACKGPTILFRIRKSIPRKGIDGC